MPKLKVFISSVRKGLERERDALPALIQALGHEPRRFEDYSARPIPSRQACLDGVGEADVYVLLLGPHYGDPLPDTGNAPTEEEFTVAQSRGIPTLIFRKTGIDLDPEQQRFVAELEAYATGFFRSSFMTTDELLTAVVEALKEQETKAPALAWTPLSQQVLVPWVVDDVDPRQFSIRPALVEVHLLPLNIEPLAASVINPLASTLASRARDFGLVSQGQALDIGSDHLAAWAIAGAPVHADTGIRLSRGRVVSLWRPLPRDFLGAIVDPDDLTVTISIFLRLASAVSVLKAAQPVTFGAALAHVGMAAVGCAADLGRRKGVSLGMRFGSSESELVRLEPAASVPAGVLPQAASEIASELIAELLPRFRASRR